MKEYRINVRFNLENEPDRRMIDYLNTVKDKRGVSRNQFIISAIGAYIEETIQADRDDTLVERLRNMFRDELNNVSFAPPSGNISAAQCVSITEDEKTANEQAVLDFLDEFG